jgi:putative FmdB family regulatory protein
MATYEYVCEIGHRVIQERSMTQEQTDFLCSAPECQEQLKRVYSTPGVLFKGSGFYSTGGR